MTRFVLMMLPKKITKQFFIVFKCCNKYSWCHSELVEESLLPKNLFIAE